MLYGEYRFEDEAAVIREEAREEGWEEGRDKLRNEVLTLIAKGFTTDEIKVHLEKKTRN